MSKPTSENRGEPEKIEKVEPTSKKSLWLLLFRIVMAAAVAIALFYTIKSSSDQFSELKIRISDIDFIWVGAAVAAYWVAMILSCTFWRQILFALGFRPGWSNTFLAFFVSQLGKYIPGKAMVVVLRTELIRNESVNIGPAAASVFVETLTWIFVGSLIACGLIFVHFHDQAALKWTAAMLALIAGVATAPPIFRWLASRLTKNEASVFAGLRWSTMAGGWFLMTAGWCFNALSLCFILSSLPDTSLTIGDFPLALACVSLATVAGFASLLPGGIGVRELVMIPLLGPRFGVPIAIIAAVLIRLVWISAELIGSGIIYLWRRSTK